MKLGEDGWRNLSLRNGQVMLVQKWLESTRMKGRK